MTDTETADQLVRRRARMMPTMAAIFVAQQAIYFSGPRMDDGRRLVNYIAISGWLMMSTVLLVLLTTGGSLFQSAAVRALANDESTRANRAAGLSVGFLATMVSAIGLYVLSLFEQLSARETIHTLMTIGIAAALLRFGLLERRALKDG
ncbi:hypothetical protein [Sphingomonas bacterium]|uniref:hypothetical protein n=1 Tax=Sphingomonas bacterium TaxID=1895847 RepID=UPI00260BBCAA|nr:hypothetical protein [Sphingomonas bacterium]